MWPNLSQMKPEPVPSTFAFSSSIRLTSSEVVLGLLTISRSLIKTTDGEASYNNSKITPPVKQSIQACRAKMKIKKKNTQLINIYAFFLSFFHFLICSGPKGRRKGEIQTSDLHFIRHGIKPIVLPLGVIIQSFLIAI